MNACLESKSETVWTEFIRRFQPTIASSVIRVSRRYGPSPPALIDDLVQETYLRLCKDKCRALREFSAHHDEAIFGFVKRVAINVALDHFRSRMTEKRRPEVEDDGRHGVESVAPAEIERVTLLKELEGRLAASESARDQTIFWLYYRQGYTAKEIASLPGMDITHKGVESCILRLTGALRSAINQKKEGKTSRATFGMVK